MSQMSQGVATVTSPDVTADASVGDPFRTFFCAARHCFVSAVPVIPRFWLISTAPPSHATG
jgi:hypothetical protein